LTSELDGTKGFSRANLYRMKKFYAFYQDHEFVAQLARQIPWWHNVEIFQKVNDCDIAIWYIQQTIENNWSRKVLVLQLKNELFERQGIKTPINNNFGERLPAPNSDLACDILKDPYVFDFLNLEQASPERIVEDALVEHLGFFMIELGKGFAFVGRQYHLTVGRHDFYIDLLFYHIKLHCYVVIELKNGTFKPEYAGKLNFYLTTIDEQLKTPEDNHSIGLILCRDKDNIVVEYALRDLNKPIGVSCYETSTDLPEEFAKILPTPEEIRQEFKKSTK